MINANLRLSIPRPTRVRAMNGRDPLLPPGSGVAGAALVGIAIWLLLLIPFLA
jgi:hypothetical protein